MSNLGMRVKGDTFEVGFEADTRDQFESFMVHIYMIADKIWPVEKTPSEEQDAKSLERMQAAEVKINRAAKDWREDHGLR